MRKPTRRATTVAVAAALLTGAATTTAVASLSRPTTQEVQTVRSLGGIPPCKHEDGAGQPGPCYWDASARGNGEGRDYVMVPTRPGDDKRPVYLTK